MKFSSRFLRWGLLSLFLIALPVAVAASSEQSIFIGADEIIDGNFIRVANVIDINGAVNGDLIVAGNSVSINGPVAGDVIAAANTIRITGPVGGSIRIVASSAIIDGSIEHNAWVVAGTTNFGPESRVGWDIYSATGSLEAKGAVGGNIRVEAGSIIIGNTVGKDVLVSVDESGQIVLYPEAHIGGNLEYQARQAEQLIVRAGATIAGQTIPKEQRESKFDYPPFIIFGPGYALIKIISFFGLLIVGVLLVSLAPKWLLRINDEMIRRPWPSIGWGFVIFLLTPIASVILLFTIIGIPLAFLLIAGWLVGIYISKVLVGFVVGLAVVRRLTANKYKASLIWPLGLGLLIVVIISSIPIFGWALYLVLLWWALGALIKIKREILEDFR